MPIPLIQLVTPACNNYVTLLSSALHILDDDETAHHNCGSAGPEIDPQEVAHAPATRSTSSNLEACRIPKLVHAAGERSGQKRRRV